MKWASYLLIELKELEILKVVSYFQLKESLPPLNIPIPSPAPAHPFGDTSKAEASRDEPSQAQHGQANRDRVWVGPRPEPSLAGLGRGWPNEAEPSRAWSG